MDQQVLRTLKGFGSSKITIVEWETPLLRRLGYPLASNRDFIFLVPDNQLRKANDIATASGLKLAKDDDLPASYVSEVAKQGFRYVYGEPMNRFILVPLSWAGIERDELTAITTTDRSLPCTIWTVPLPAICAAYLRIITRESRQSRVRLIAEGDLANIIAYSMLDMSYEVDYMDDEAVGIWEGTEDEAVLAKRAEKAKKAALEMEDALNDIRGWNFRTNEDWTRDTLIQLVSAKIDYEQLPSNQA
ncbi:hypothetical protein CMUS01_09544 [Colletotrichum musicola]|uniref:Uncharacterized protein n=1 Tax=Colletotrichum musicola TaxID=2175873 RepID=A0A8H6K894_9PEZI|nr:hypothetical protein CMUS01_09544 [Colletotrichum musicola]